MRLALVLVTLCGAAVAAQVLTEPAGMAAGLQRDLNNQLLHGPATMNDSAPHQHYNVMRELWATESVPEISGSKNADTKVFVRATELLFDQDPKQLDIYSVGQILLMGLMASIHSSSYGVTYQHRYDNPGDLRLAAGPQVNQAQCLRHLQDLSARVKQQQEVDGFWSTDINLHQIMSTWARGPSEIMIGRLVVDGHYEGCMQSKYLFKEETIDMHYCMLSYKMPDWPQVERHNLTDLKVSVCIPKTCDSTDYANKYDLVSSLAATQVQPMDTVNLQAVSLYCVPDEESPLRSIRASPSASATATCFALWIAMLVFATYKYNAVERQQKSSGPNSEIALSATSIKAYRMFSITNNLKLLFNTTKESSLAESQPSKQEAQRAQLNPRRNSETGGGQVGQAAECAERISGSKPIDLRCIEGIKVIAMCYVIMGHVIMCIPAITGNGRDLASQGAQSVVMFLANLVPAFAVNSFFMITGLLTCYLMFKQNKSQSIITSPGKWAALMLYRYLRIMPMYAIMVLYCKHLARYTSSGPLWDYGTSDLSQRKICEQEPWAYTLTFTSNFLSPMNHCIPGGWYLSNDIQFLLVTPIFMIALHARPRLGKALLYLGILAGYIAGFNSIYSSSVDDLRPIAMFQPYAFKTYVSHLNFNYTYPQYRIPAYLIGLLIGYALYELEEAKSRHEQLDENARAKESPPGLSRAFKDYGAYLVTFLIVGCCATPYIGRLITFNKFYARFMVAFITPSYHVLFAVAIGMLLMLCTTGNGNKFVTAFLADPFWKPFARMSLCAVLVNVEVIKYIIQSHTRHVFVNNSFILLLNAVCIAGTYAASTVLCVLFEAPVRAGLNAVLTSAMARMAGKRKNKTAKPPAD